MFALKFTLVFLLFFFSEANQRELICPQIFNHLSALLKAEHNVTFLNTVTFFLVCLVTNNGECILFRFLFAISIMFINTYGHGPCLGGGQGDMSPPSFWGWGTKGTLSPHVLHGKSFLFSA